MARFSNGVNHQDDVKGTCTMKIAVDAMGGDFAPHNIVEGAFLAAKEYGVKVVLVGDEDQVSKELTKYPTSKLPIYIHHAPFVVAMHDSPSTVIRRMKETSIKVALDLVKGAQVSGVVSAGNSGAAMALAMYILRKLEGVERPAIATIHPTTKGIYRAHRFWGECRLQTIPSRPVRHDGRCLCKIYLGKGKATDWRFKQWRRRRERK